MARNCASQPSFVVSAATSKHLRHRRNPLHLKLRRQLSGRLPRHLRSGLPVRPPWDRLAINRLHPNTGSPTTIRRSTRTLPEIGSKRVRRVRITRITDMHRPLPRQSFAPRTRRVRYPRCRSEDLLRPAVPERRPAISHGASPSVRPELFLYHFRSPIWSS